MMAMLLVVISSVATSFWLEFYEPPPLIPSLIVISSLIIYWITYIRFILIFPEMIRVTSQSEHQQRVLLVLKIILFIMSITYTFIFLSILQQNLSR
jgi:hypothetical protein